MREELETRASKYGRALANQIRPILIFYSKRGALDYIDILGKELSRYSFRKRMVGEPKHEGCLWNLKGERIDVYDPQEEANFLKECLDQTYNKERARNMFNSLIDALENLRDDVLEGTL